MLEVTKRHLEQYGWTGKGQLEAVGVERLLADHNLKYFDKVHEFTSKYEGLRIFTRFIEPELTAKYMEDIPSEPFTRHNSNYFICTDLAVMLEYFESYDANPPFACLIGQDICPVGVWRSMMGHGFIIIDTDGMLYITMSTGIWAISFTDGDFFDRLINLNELFRDDPERYHAIVDLSLYKGK